VTFSLVARCPTTNAFGMVLSSSSPAVAARCIHLRHGVGGAASQNITDPRLGELILDLMQAGRSASEALDTVIATEPTVEYRQLSAVDAQGRAAVFSGQHVLGVFGQRREENLAAVGNMLANEGVIDALIDGFAASRGDDLADQLIDALAAGLRAGGEVGPVHSAGLVVTSAVGWPVTDLRVDFADEPVDDLRRLWEVWSPQRHDYITRGVDPSSAPSYGVAGDE